MTPVEIHAPLDRVTTTHERRSMLGYVTTHYVLTDEIWSWVMEHLGEAADFADELRDNGHRWHWYRSGTCAVFTFANEDDAMLFKLTWGGV